jgi:hypothetical protein
MSQSILSEGRCFRFPSPVNMYGSCIVSHRGKVKVLIASRHQVFCISSTDSPDGTVRWNSAPILLANVPSKQINIRL